MRKDYLKNYLKAACKGRTHRKTSQELEHELGLSGTQLRELVNQLRKERIPIASDCYGYFYASSGHNPRIGGIPPRDQHEGR